MIEEYKQYLLEKSKRVESVIYSHYDSANVIKNPLSYGYTSTSEALDKIHTILSVWSKEDVDTYSEFIARHRDIKLNEIGI